MSVSRTTATAHRRIRRHLKLLCPIFFALAIASAQAAQANKQQAPAKPDQTAKSTAKGDTAPSPANASDAASNPGASTAKAQDASPKSPQEQLKEDCANLLKMTRELKAEMDRTPPDTLSLAIVQKARAIEQLSQKIQREMKDQKGKH